MSAIQDAAWKLMEEAEWNLAAAKREFRAQRAWLESLVSGETKAFALLVTAMCDQAMDAALENVWRSDRPALRSGAQVSRPAARPVGPIVLAKGEVSIPNPARLAAQRQYVAEVTGLLAWPVIMDGDGTMLAYLSKADLEMMATRDIGQGKSLIENGWFYRAIAGLLKKSTDVVVDYLTNADLERLQRQVRTRYEKTA